MVSGRGRMDLSKEVEELCYRKRYQKKTLHRMATDITDGPALPSLSWPQAHAPAYVRVHVIR